MAKRASISRNEAKLKGLEEQQRGLTGTKGLLRGLEVLEAVAEGKVLLEDLAAQLALPQTTIRRLANALIERRYLTLGSRCRYQLGPKLLQLGFHTDQADLVQIAQPRIQALGQALEDTVELGIRDGGRVVYLTAAPGHRRVAISSRVGRRASLTSTGLGKALLLDEDEHRWKELFREDRESYTMPGSYECWRRRMSCYVEAGLTYGLEENEDQISCIAAPIRDASRRIVGAIGVSSPVRYMHAGRVEALMKDVLGTAEAISCELGWRPSKEKDALLRRRVRAAPRVQRPASSAGAS